MGARKGPDEDAKPPKEPRALRPIAVGGSSESVNIHARRRYRVKIDGAWYEGQFSRQWFGWQFDGYQNGIQLNLVDEVFEIPSPPQAGRPRSVKRPPAPGP